MVWEPSVSVRLREQGGTHHSEADPGARGAAAVAGSKLT